MRYTVKSGYAIDVWTNGWNLDTFDTREEAEAHAQRRLVIDGVPYVSIIEDPDDEPKPDIEDCPMCEGSGDTRLDLDDMGGMIGPCSWCGGTGASRVAPPRREEEDEPDAPTEPSTFDWF